MSDAPLLTVPTFSERLEALRTMVTSGLKELVDNLNLESRLPSDFIAGLKEEDQALCWRASMICYSISSGAQIPREMQLKAVLADRHKKDSLIAAGTGSGKTLPMALNIYLDDLALKPTSLLLSPLKRIQLSQLVEFNNRYRIPTVVINDDTPRDEGFYNRHVFDRKNRTPGSARLLIVTVEQLFKTKEGHFPQLSLLLRNQHFQRTLARITVDEAHTIVTAGISRYGLDAFRPAWGKLDELKAILPNAIQWAAFSATFPPYILKTVEQKILRPGYSLIHLTSNRPNTIYATHQVLNSIEDLRNYECFIAQPFVLDQQPHVLIFVDNKDLASRIVNHLESFLPSEFRGRNMIMHYHSQMSDKYLSITHDSFIRPDGACRIMVATSGQSVGVDFPNVKIVCPAGLPSTTVDVLQRAGRALRNSADDSLFIMFYEPWIHEISLTDYDAGDLSDPDRPRMILKPTSRRQDRLPFSLALLINEKKCLWAAFAKYLHDESPEALAYTTKFCCNSAVDHPDSGFNLDYILPGKLLVEDLPLFPAGPSTRKPNTKYRPTKERPALDFRLIEWLKNEHLCDPLRTVRPPHFILSHAQRSELVRVNPKAIKGPTDITMLLNESMEWETEWASKLFDVMQKFDADIATLKSRKQEQARQLKRKRE